MMLPGKSGKKTKRVLAHTPPIDIAADCADGKYVTLSLVHYVIMRHILSHTQDLQYRDGRHIDLFYCNTLLCMYMTGNGCSSSHSI